jgi:hypothetical protein
MQTFHSDSDSESCSAEYSSHTEEEESSIDGDSDFGSPVFRNKISEIPDFEDCNEYIMYPQKISDQEGTTLNLKGLRAPKKMLSAIKTKSHE